jgi:hypothetical protein
MCSVASALETIGHTVPRLNIQGKVVTGSIMGCGAMSKLNVNVMFAVWPFHSGPAGE